MNMNEKRRHKRFPEFAKIDAPEISVFSGVLCDISLGGCLIRFPLGAQADPETDYEIFVSPTRKMALTPIKLIVRPVRIHEKEDSYELGCTILRSPGTPLLQEYIKELTSTEGDAYDQMADEIEGISNDPN